MNKETERTDYRKDKYPLNLILQYIVLISLILYFGRTVFIPLSFSLLISFVLYPVCVWLEKKGFNKNLAIGIALGMLILIFAGIVILLLWQLHRFTGEWQTLRLKASDAIDDIVSFISSTFNIAAEKQYAWLSNLFDSSGSSFIPFLRETFYSLSVSLVLFILIPIMSALILYHRKKLAGVLYSFFPERRKAVIHQILHETVHAFYGFIKGMLLVYLIVGILNSIGLAIVGVPHPVLFGFIASVLTFIPYVGIIIASLLPITVSWITYNSILYPLGVILVFSIVQYLEANLIFPFSVSSRLKINTLVTIIAILAGGVLWGAAGMILFIPFIGILKLIADKTESLKVVADLLGTKEKEKSD